MRFHYSSLSWHRQCLRHPEGRGYPSRKRHRREKNPMDLETLNCLICIPVFVAWESNPSFCEVFPSSLWFPCVLGLASVPVVWSTIPLCIHWPPSTTFENGGLEHLRPSSPTFWDCKEHRGLSQALSSEVLHGQAGVRGRGPRRESSSEAAPKSLLLLDPQSYWLRDREGAAGLRVWTATSLNSLLLSASCHTFPSSGLWKYWLDRKR